MPEMLMVAMVPVLPWRPMPATRTRRRPSRSGRRPGRSAPARRRGRATREPGPLARGRAAAGRQLGGHRSDAAAVVAAVLGVLCVLGLVSDLAGPIGWG